jgi:glycosyltransferase involved in cell wall biosynthesis
MNQPKTGKTICMLLQSHYEFDIRVRRKAEALVAAGYEVDVLALRSPGNPASTFTLCGVNVHTLSLGKNRGSLARYIFEYGAFFIWALAKLFLLDRTRNYAVVEANTLPDFLIFAGAVARWKGALLILDMHEITPEFYISKYGIAQESWLAGLLRWIESASFRYADRVITINAPIQALLESRGLAPEKSMVLMNAVDELMFSREVAAFKPEPAPEGRFVFMYHGTLTRMYGLDIAIEAFALAHARMPGAEFWILGSGPEKPALESLVAAHHLESSVRFVGSVFPEQIPAWLCQCDVGLLSTRRNLFLEYSFSNKLSEYIIVGKAVIVSRLKTIRSYFSEEALAYFEPDDAADFAVQMLRLFQSSSLRENQAQQARVEYAPICWEVMKQRYLVLVGHLSGSEPVCPECSVAAPRELLSRQ